MSIHLYLSVSPLPSPAPSFASTPVSVSAPQATLKPLPPKAIYSFKEEFYNSIQARAVQNYYAFRIGQSTKINKDPWIKIVCNCDRCGTPPPENYLQGYLQARKKRTTTQKIRFQFSVLAVESSVTPWELRYKPGIEYSRHNHPSSQLNSSHSEHRKLALAEMNQVRAIHNIVMSDLSYHTP
ncbi:hypothetical protein GcM3_223021 [Golovinomyces cichoracearum]|uniref:Uncharacterized protein n=1 Tax=Golovinomyces cichoracearum TaxID=62708 RepID=A0A420H1K4_9PEZI|nr:hypothetical protein GcM3_223021 [Golovinomyces cichoracearum]